MCLDLGAVMRTPSFRFLKLVPILLIIGCVGVPGALTSSGPSVKATAALPVSGLLGEWDIPESNIKLAPAGDAVAKVSADTAYGVCLTGPASCDRADPTAIQLAVMTDGGYGPVDSKGVIKLLIDHELVWAISWRGVPCPPMIGGGPIQPSGAPARTPGHFLCDEYVFVDATSGTYLGSYSEGHR